MTLQSLRCRAPSVGLPAGHVRQNRQIAGRPAQVRLLQQRRPPGGPAGGRWREQHRTSAALWPWGGVRSEDASFDPDCYTLDDSEDPDDYGDIVAAGAATPGAAAAVAAAGSHGGGAGDGGSSSSSSNSSSSAVGAEQQQQSQQQQGQQRRQRPHEALGRSISLLMLFGAAVDRLASRLQTAVMATARVAWQLGGEAAQAMRLNALRAKVNAQEGFAASPAGKKVEKWKKKLEAAQQDLPEDLWGKVMWIWDRPHMQKIRLTITMANFSIRLPALVALVATQIGLLSTSLSLPMLAPLLLGTGMLLRSIRTNASLVFPRIGLLVVLLWLLWFANSVIQNTVAYLRKQGAIDQRMANNIHSAAELTVLVTAGVILLSMLGVNVSALLLPAGIALAVAAKDLSHNFLAGFFLMMVQPFRLGDRVGVTLQGGSPGSFGSGGTWFEGVCEKVDLRYTSLRQGKRRLMVPNSAFLQQPFMITEDAGVPGMPPGAEAPPPGTGAPGAGHPFITHDGRHVWQAYVNGGPVHQELAREAAVAAGGPAAAAAAAAVAQGSAPAAPAQQQQQQQQDEQQRVQYPQAPVQPAQGQAQAQQPQQQDQQQQQQQWQQPELPPHLRQPAGAPVGAPLQQYQQAFELQQQHLNGGAPNGGYHGGVNGGGYLSEPYQAPPPGTYPGPPPPGGYPLYYTPHNFM